ncbi:MAG TPA: hypothetical protein PLJ84_00855 [Bacteroidales bacterium]|nr:hypothetical protein [Bacteroidales bacterium]HPT01120.1 hypothetical protein [Bacteroidales bacterium]
MKSRIAGIFLIFCLVSPIITTYAWLKYKKYAVRKEVKKQIIAGIDKDQLVLLKFARNESRDKLRWEHAGEFEYNGRMYDVVDTDTTANGIVYWCWCDDEESKLNRQLSLLTGKILHTDPRNREQQKQISSYFKSLYFSENSGWHTALQSIATKRFTIHSNRLFLFSFPPPTPPPRVS